MNSIYGVFDQVKTGLSNKLSTSTYIPLAYHDHQLVNLLRNHSAGDFCIIGPSGCGKTVIVNKFAEILNYEIEPIVLYQVESSWSRRNEIGF